MKLVITLFVIIAGVLVVMANEITGPVEFRKEGLSSRTFLKTTFYSDS